MKKSELRKLIREQIKLLNEENIEVVCDCTDSFSNDTNYEIIEGEFEEL